MAEFCLDCFNKLHGTHYTESDVTLMEDLCEHCGEVKPCILSLDPPGLLNRIWKTWLESLGMTPNLP